MSKFVRRANSLDLGPKDIVRNAKLGAVITTIGLVPWTVILLAVLISGELPTLESISNAQAAFFFAAYFVFIPVIFIGLLVLVGAGVLKAFWWLWYLGMEHD